MPDSLTIHRKDRGANTLRVTPTDQGFKLTTTGGGNITPAEYDEIAAYAESREGADTFLAKLKARVER